MLGVFGEHILRQSQKSCTVQRHCLPLATSLSPFLIPPPPLWSEAVDRWHSVLIGDGAGCELFLFPISFPAVKLPHSPDWKYDSQEEKSGSSFVRLEIFVVRSFGGGPTLNLRIEDEPAVLLERVKEKDETLIISNLVVINNKVQVKLSTLEEVKLLVICGAVASYRQQKDIHRQTLN